jgi:hypothetical protein
MFQTLSGSGPHEGVSLLRSPLPSVFRCCARLLEATFEAYASPFTCYFRQYCGPFPDTDGYFGSRGRFTDFRPIEGSFVLASPPFCEEMAEVGQSQTWTRFFRWGGGGSDLRLGGGINPPTPKNFACGEQKKKVAGLAEKFFTTWKKLPYPPSSFGRRYGGPWGVYTPLYSSPHIQFWTECEIGRLRCGCRRMWSTCCHYCRDRRAVRCRSCCCSQTCSRRTTRRSRRASV